MDPIFVQNLNINKRTSNPKQIKHYHLEQISTYKTLKSATFMASKL